MSTAPKLGYAKIGKGSKGKVESVSSELVRTNSENADDIFAHMNQDNLKYIKKELKLKKNRSENQRPQSPRQEQRDLPQQHEEEVTQRNKLYDKYGGEEAVSEKEPHLQETQRRSDHQKPLPIVYPQEMEEDYDPTINSTSKQQNREMKYISSSQNAPESGMFKNFQKKEADSKMYMSLPQDEGKKRVASIEGFFGEAMSTNLNRHDGGLFIEFLEEYISDLNHSKHLRLADEVSIDKRNREEIRSSRQQRSKQNERNERRQKNPLQQQLKESLKKLERLKRNSDTFGQPNSKFTLNSEQDINALDNRQLQHMLKIEKLNTISLAKQIQKLRKLIGVKEEIIKNLQVNNELLKQEIMHVKIQQEIINKTKKINQINQHYSNNNPQPKSMRIINHETIYKQNAGVSGGSYHVRHASINPNKPAISNRSSFKPYDDFAELFQEIGPPPVNKYQQSREKVRKRERESLQKLEREYDQFLNQCKRPLKYVREDKRVNEEVF